MARHCKTRSAAPLTRYPAAYLTYFERPQRSASAASPRFRRSYAADRHPQPNARSQRQRLEQYFSGLGEYDGQRQRQRRQPDSLLGGWRAGEQRYAASAATASVSSQGTHTVGVRVLDNAGNISQQYTQSVNIDLTAPATTATPSSSPNAAGWYNASVTINLNAADTGGSGVAQVQYSLSGAQTGSQMTPGSAASVTISANGSTMLTYFAVDNAGNTETAHMLTVNVDTTQPAIVPSVSGTLGANGWYVSNVTVSWSVTDPYSGIASSYRLRHGFAHRLHGRHDALVFGH